MPVLLFENKKFPQAAFWCGEYPFEYKQGVAFLGHDAYFVSSLYQGVRVLWQTDPAPTLEGMKRWIESTFGDSAPRVRDYEPGTCFKRIARPLMYRTAAHHPPVDHDTMNESCVALKILLNKLEDLFETVEPAHGNEFAFGHKIRELLLLACMEVESAWSAVLKENSYPGSRFTTKDYVKLCKPMFLDAYALELQSYRDFRDFRPFADWDPNKPSLSLPWYDAYNQTKHDREGKLQEAHLRHAIHAVGAVVVMMYAQFGSQFVPGALDSRDAAIRAMFKVSKFELDQYAEEFYIPEMYRTGDSSAGASPRWREIDYPF